MRGYDTLRIGVEPLPEADFMGEGSVRAYRTHAVGSLALSLGIELPERWQPQPEPLVLAAAVEQPMLPIELNQ